MPATPELAALQDLVGRLEQRGIQYMLTGSLAMAYYAQPRMTRDIDLVVALDEKNVPDLVEALGNAYFADTDAIAEAFRTFRPCNVVHLETVVKVDFVPRKPGEYRRTEFNRRRRVNFAGVDLWIVSAEDLVLSKLEWAKDSGSELQRRDVAQLLRAPLDREYLSGWASRLGIDSHLRESEGE